MKMYSIEFFSLQLLREKFQNALEISGDLVSQKCGHAAVVAAINILHLEALKQYLFNFSISHEIKWRHVDNKTVNKLKHCN